MELPVKNLAIVLLLLLIIIFAQLNCISHSQLQKRAQKQIEATFARIIKKSLKQHISGKRLLIHKNPKVGDFAIYEEKATRSYGAIYTSTYRITSVTRDEVTVDFYKVGHSKQVLRHRHFFNYLNKHTFRFICEKSGIIKRVFVINNDSKKQEELLFNKNKPIHSHYTIKTYSPYYSRAMAAIENSERMVESYKKYMNRYPLNRNYYLKLYRAELIKFKRLKQYRKKGLSHFLAYYMKNFLKTLENTVRRYPGHKKSYKRSMDLIKNQLQHIQKIKTKAGTFRNNFPAMTILMYFSGYTMPIPVYGNQNIPFVAISSHPLYKRHWPIELINYGNSFDPDRFRKKKKAAKKTIKKKKIIYRYPFGIVFRVIGNRVTIGKRRHAPQIAMGRRIYTIIGSRKVYMRVTMPMHTQLQCTLEPGSRIFRRRLVRGLHMFY
mgnify:CR=1 FL=1